MAVSTCGATIALVSASQGTAVAGVNSDRSTISRLEKRIADQGAQVQSLVARYDHTESHMFVIDQEMARDRVDLAGEQRSEAKASLRLRNVAIDAYISAVSGSASLFPGSASASTLPAREVYLGVASGSLDGAMTTLKVDQHRTSVTETALRSAQARTAATLRQLTSARQAAQAATASDQALLGHVSRNLLSLVTAANARRSEAEEDATEDAIAAAQEAVPRQATTVATPSRPAQSAPGTYANPLRSAGGLQPERIDQGVDYAGYGPIYALGDGVVLSTVNGGWPGGTYIAYRLTDGPADGLIVYAAEDINPAVQVGETVTPKTVLGQIYEGPEGIETGWADSGTGSTMAAEYDQFNGSNTTAFGYNFSQLLQSLGAPGGVVQTNPPSGELPSGWPQW